MEPFKNHFNRKTISILGEDILAVYPSFDTKQFLEQSTYLLDELELKARVQQIASALRRCLPSDYKEALTILLKCGERVSQDGIFFIYWPYLQFIEDYGLNDLQLSLDAMRSLTPIFSAEFAIRPFIVKDREGTLETMLKWTEDSNPHVRRLASEGSRPRLPWGIALPELIANPLHSAPILEKLKQDSSEYVRRSVSNHMNDFSKEHPLFLTTKCEEWAANAAPEDVEMQKLVKHALRNLLKKGDVKALDILGFSTPKFSLVDLSLASDKVQFGESLQFNMTIKAEKTQSWMIDYAIHHKKANGSLTPKVFKWCVKKVKKGSILDLSKGHKFKAITTRKYYSGEHAIEVFVNGKSLGKHAFDLIM